MPGLVRYDEVAAGAINHALRFTLSQTRSDAAGSNFEVVQMTPTWPGYEFATAPKGSAPVIISFTSSATP